jgi:DNA-directed RNA polymerase
MQIGFMPNFIHSLDAANVHLLCKDLEIMNVEGNENKFIPLYTVHDCFASTPNNMFLIEDKVKNAFIDIYFKDEAYLIKLHNNFLR